MKPTYAQAWQLNEHFEGGGWSLGNRNEISSLGLIWKWSTVWKIVLGLNWPGFCHFKNEETWDPGKKWPVQVYLYSLGKPGARGKVSCLPMTPLPSFESIHHFDFYVLSHTQKVHLSIWLNWEKPNLQLDAFQGRENRCPWTPPQPPPPVSQHFQTGNFYVLFLPSNPTPQNATTSYFVWANRDFNHSLLTWL